MEHHYASSYKVHINGKEVCFTIYRLHKWLALLPVACVSHVPDDVNHLPVCNWALGIAKSPVVITFSCVAKSLYSGHCGECAQVSSLPAGRVCVLLVSSANACRSCRCNAKPQDRKTQSATDNNPAKKHMHHAHTGGNDATCCEMWTIKHQAQVISKRRKPRS